MVRQLLRGIFNIVSGKSHGVFINRAGRMVAVGKALPKGAYLNAVEIADSDFIRIVPVGKFPTHPDGPHEITFENVQQMVSNFQSSGTDVLFDYEHRSLWGDTIAAGWSTEVEARQDGLYIKYPDFTKNAQQKIEEREYRYFSPVYYLDGVAKDGSNLGAVLDSVAITNRPWMDREIDHIRNHDTKQEESEMKYSKEYKEAIGLKEDATDEQVEEKIAKLNEIAAEGVKLQKGEEKTEEREEKSEEREEKSEEREDASVALNSRLDRMEKMITGLITGDKKERAEALVESAVSDGKILPADKDVWLNNAIADFAGTKGKLDGRKKNSALPGKVSSSSDKDEEITDDSDVAEIRKSIRNSKRDFVDQVVASGFKINKDVLKG